MGALPLKGAASTGRRSRTRVALEKLPLKARSMNRYPLWKYAIILVALVVSGLYALPNLFGEAPAVQVSPGKATVKVDTGTVTRVEQALAAQQIVPTMVTLEGTSVRVRFDDTDTQLKARDALDKALNPDPTDPGHVVALNLVPRTPAWLAALGASPMYLGLDLRGGVHFMLQVDMKAALERRADVLATDLRNALREKNVRHGGISRNGQTIELRVRDTATLNAATDVLREQFADLTVTETAEGADTRITATIRPEAARAVQDQALKQNITTLNNRINELGVAELHAGRDLGAVVVQHVEPGLLQLRGVRGGRVVRAEQGLQHTIRGGKGLDVGQREVRGEASFDPNVAVIVELGGESLEPVGVRRDGVHGVDRHGVKLESDHVILEVADQRRGQERVGSEKLGQIVNRVLGAKEVVVLGELVGGAAGFFDVEFLGGIEDIGGVLALAGDLVDGRGAEQLPLDHVDVGPTIQVQVQGSPVGGVLLGLHVDIGDDKVALLVLGRLGGRGGGTDFSLLGLGVGGTGGGGLASLAHFLCRKQDG